jgi:hypothetical protein
MRALISARYDSDGGTRGYPMRPPCEVRTVEDCGVIWRSWWASGTDADLRAYVRSLVRRGYDYADYGPHGYSVTYSVTYMGGTFKPQGCRTV